MNGHLRRKFGLTRKEFDEMVANQNDNCAICGKPPRNKTKGGKLARLSVDHAHVENYKDLPGEQKALYIRGLLCHHCNIVLGYASDDIKVLENAISYLKKFANKNNG